LHIQDIPGTEFPSGRKTRVAVGSNGAVQGSYFCQGFVSIRLGGSVPLHNHAMEETYTILKGQGLVNVNGEEQAVTQGDLVLIPSGQNHALFNTGTEEMQMMFVYAPPSVAEHWQQELSGNIP
jgi:quercetin dioxygenase-like cupin family protein